MSDGVRLGAAFLMNALTCIHWFVLTIIPLAPHPNDPAPVAR